MSQGVTAVSWRGREVLSHIGKPGRTNFSGQAGGAGRGSSERSQIEPMQRWREKADLVCRFFGEFLLYRYLSVSVWAASGGSTGGGDKRRDRFWEVRVKADSTVLDEVLLELEREEREVQPRGSYSKTRIWIRSLTQNVNVKQLFDLIHFMWDSAAATVPTVFGRSPYQLISIFLFHFLSRKVVDYSYCDLWPLMTTLAPVSYRQNGCGITSSHSSCIGLLSVALR